MKTSYVAMYSKLTEIQCVILPDWKLYLNIQGNGLRVDTY